MYIAEFLYEEFKLWCSADKYLYGIINDIKTYITIIINKRQKHLNI